MRAQIYDMNETLGKNIIQHTPPPPAPKKTHNLDRNPESENAR